MLNRLIIFSMLVFSSVAIPMQTETNYQTRTIQSIDACGKQNANMISYGEIQNKTIEEQILNVSCKN